MSGIAGVIAAWSAKTVTHDKLKGTHTSWVARPSEIDGGALAAQQRRVTLVNFPPCPYLPTARAGLDWKALHAYRDALRGEKFYYDCLEYGQALWQRGLAARALLCLDRAFGAELSGNEPLLVEWPMPYAATAWVMARTPGGTFLGNSRVHFQHYADRMNEPRRDQRRWRAWACWALARVVLPELPPDAKHAVIEPTFAQILQQLKSFGVPGEAELFSAVLTSAEGMQFSQL